MNKSILYAIATVFIWATSAPVVKLMTADIPSMEALALSSLLAFLFMLAVNKAKGTLKILKTYQPKDFAVLTGLGFTGLFLYYAAYYYGISVMPAQEACIINYLWPIMILIFSVILLKEPLTWKKALAMACSFTGIVVLVLGDGSLQGGSRLAGIAACVAAAVCYGLFSVLNKKAGYEQLPAMMIFWLVTSVCSFAVCFFTIDWVPVTGIRWLGLLWMGIAVDAIAYLLWALALGGAKSTALVANLAYLTPFMTVALSALVLKEPVQTSALIGLVIIVGGILLQSIGTKE